MVPYTIDAVSAIRYQAANCTPASEIQKILGWDASMLERVCRKHGIEIFVPMPTTAPMLPDVPASAKPLPRRLSSVPLRAWRSKGGVRFPDDGLTPTCDGAGT